MNRRDILQALSGSAAALKVPGSAWATTAQKVVPAASLKAPEALRTAILNSARRPEADRKRDDSRNPAETMVFYGIKPGMTVAELVTSRGYFTGAAWAS